MSSRRLRSTLCRRGTCLRPRRRSRRSYGLVTVHLHALLHNYQMLHLCCHLSKHLAVPQGDGPKSACRDRESSLDLPASFLTGTIVTTIRISSGNQQMAKGMYLMHSTRGSSLNRTLEKQSDSEDDAELPSEGLCSQPSGNVFQSDVWLRAERDLMRGCPTASTVATCTLRWVRGKALAGQLPNLRVPLLRVALRTIDCSLEDPFVLFHDPTGQMPGTLHREVREAHEARLRPGTVLVLRQVGVLTTRRTLRNHYLNVTTNNLVSIYHASDQLRPDHVEVVRLQDISLLEVAQSIRDIQERRLIIDLPASHLLDHRDENLFSSIGTSALGAGGPNMNRRPLYTRNTTPQVQNNSSVNWQKGLAHVEVRSSDETSSSVSKFLPTHDYSHVPPHNGNSQVFNSSANAVAHSRTSLNCSVSGAQDLTFGHQRSNVMSLSNKPSPNNVVSARGSGFKPKTSQLGSLGSSCHVNCWSSGVMVGDDSTLPPDVCETRCSAKVVDLDDERRIVENVLHSIDPSQLFDEDF